MRRIVALACFLAVLVPAATTAQAPPLPAGQCEGQLREMNVYAARLAGSRQQGETQAARDLAAMMGEIGRLQAENADLKKRLEAATKPAEDKK